MPIYEFKCMDCNACMEVLVINTDDTVEMQCRQCASTELERIMSLSSHSMREGCRDHSGRFGSQSRTCSSGSCTTYHLPGPD